MSISAYLFKYIDINPKELLAKGALAKKISMDKLQPFCRDVPEYEIAKFSGGTRFRNGDTIMARITPCLENGKTAMVNILEPGEVGFGSTEFIVFRAKEGYTDPNFVYYLVKSSFVRDPAIKSMVGSSGRQRVQTDVVQNLIVPFPSLLEQRKIASILKSLDDKIALNTAINDNLEQQTQAIFKSWFVNFEPFNGIMPYNWAACTLGDIAGTGTTQQQLTVPDFRKTEIVVPDKTIMSAFTEAVTPIFEQIWVNEDENIKLAEIRDSLLPKLMSGELDVSSVEL